MPVPLLDISIHDDVLLTQIEQGLLSAVRSSNFIGGDTIERFLREFADYCGAQSCIPVANGTDALVLALRGFGIGPGDEVITVPYTFIATAEAVTLVGATIRFVDIHPKYYTMDPTLIEKALTPKTKAIIPVHLYGQPAQMDPIMDVARRHNVRVIEDAAQAHGAEYNGRRVGSLGDAACFSFYPTKNLGGFGDGGAVVSNSAELIRRIAQLANHGRAKQYFHDVEGTNSRLDVIQAVALLAKLKRIDAWNQRRRDIALRYTQVLRQSAFISPPEVASTSQHVFHLYCVETPHRDSLIQFLNDHGIGNGVYYPLPLHLQPAYVRYRHKRGDFPMSERAAERILALPMYPDLTDEQVDEVCRRLAQFSPKVIKLRP